MQTYIISFYPGIVLSKPYFVTVEEPTTDYQTLLDILVDSQLADSDGLFDDENEYPDEEVVICGNSDRRLITGGMLNIRELSSDDVKQFLQEKAGTDNPDGTVKIGFVNDNEDEDETEFTVENADDLTSLWMEFCKENNFIVTNVNYVTVLGYEEFEVLLSAKENGRVTVKVPCGADDDMIISEVIKEEMAGNAIFFDRLVEFGGFNNRPTPSVIAMLSSSELFTQMSPQQRDDIYRMVRSDFVKQDVLGVLQEDEALYEELTENDELNGLVEYVVNNIVYYGKENSNISYWDNINMFIQKGLGH